MSLTASTKFDSPLLKTKLLPNATVMFYLFKIYCRYRYYITKVHNDLNK